MIIPFHSNQINTEIAEDEQQWFGLNLNQYLIKHPSATFFLRAAGDSMIQAGIFPNDILVVDRALEAQHGQIVIAVIAGELTIKKLHKTKQEIKLIPANPRYKTIHIDTKSKLEIWGVVTYAIHACRT